MKKFAFWKYDRPPYLIGSEIEKFYEDGTVAVTSMKGYVVKPIKIVPLEVGIKLRNELEIEFQKYEATRIASLNKLKKFVEEIYNYKEN